jgi:hypothetical protein
MIVYIVRSLFFLPAWARSFFFSFIPFFIAVAFLFFLLYILDCIFYYLEREGSLGLGIWD